MPHCCGPIGRSRRYRSPSPPLRLGPNAAAAIIAAKVTRGHCTSSVAVVTPTATRTHNDRGDPGRGCQWALGSRRSNHVSSHSNSHTRAVRQSHGPHQNDEGSRNAVSPVTRVWAPPVGWERRASMKCSVYSAAASVGGRTDTNTRPLALVRNSTRPLISANKV
jgi:hypothetical protein